ncbi:MAG: hypothetical protein ACRDSP_21245 [Pseudonocardiaceae bacterium]
MPEDFASTNNTSIVSGLNTLAARRAATESTDESFFCVTEK